MQQLPVHSLIDWFVREKRKLPWRDSPSPYAVLVSEIMLQQTQASVVIPYFERWMKLFPTIQHLADVSIDKVLKAWEGLGYYSRARNLHLAAQKIAQDYEGKISLSSLDELPGVGPYTKGAILSFAFHQKAPAVDGNVQRVIARFFLIEESLSKTAVKEEITERVREILPNHEPWVVMEALIELGATVCSKLPKCSVCPLQEECLGFQEGKASSLPVKSKRASTVLLTRFVTVFYCKGFLLLKKGEFGKMMGGLYEFPYSEKKKRGVSFPLKAAFVKDLQKVTHTFTKYKATLYPSLWKVDSQQHIAGLEWVSFKTVEDLAFSSGHRKILEQVIGENFTY